MALGLAPCPSCARHLRASEEACPFCGAAVAGKLSPLPGTSKRLTRAAAFAFTASLAAVAGVHCGDDDAGGSSSGKTPTVDSGAEGGSGGQPGPMYGAPAPDAGRDAAGDAASDAASDASGDAADEGGSSGALYGAPLYG
ncbi:MAG: hypothetical protein JNL38_15945, partial [Myxococcales bacterium]|nr:hypothetical protein [Myxococcales bacterium]